MQLNAEQMAAVTDMTSSSIRVIAGPGTGKTAVLTSRVAHLMSERGVAPENILTLTFTNRAAQEMRVRVGDLVGADVERITMGTFHAICLYILREEVDFVSIPSQVQLHITPGFGVFDEVASQKLVKEILCSDFGDWEKANNLL
jgi:DNA helicase-2/ATP-dependent DNA helicase PcrA